MGSIRWLATSLFLVLVLVTEAGRVEAQVVVMDQIGPNGTFTAGGSVVHSQVLEPGVAQFSDSAVDNFTLASGMTLNLVQAAMRGLGSTTFAAFASVTDWEVAIYSSKNAAAASQTGDVASVHVAPGLVTVAGGFNSDASSALVSVPVNIALGAGGYFVALLPHLNLQPGNQQLGVYISAFGGTPGDSNGFLANPGGGGGFPGNVLNLNSNLAYRVTASVPEPSPLLLTALASIVTVGVPAARRRLGGSRQTG